MAPEQTTFIPVNVITGFLGSGKTTLLQRLLAAPQLADTAVLVNEFGEVGLDHHLLQRLDDEIVLLQSGCLCCTIRGDLSAAMRDLYAKRERGEIVPFRRLVIETTGLADPVPILSTIMTEPVLRYHFRLGNVVATVDAVNGLANLEHQPESAKQAAVADRVVITKTDIADGMAIRELSGRLRKLNPSAWQLETAPSVTIDPDQLLTRDVYGLEGKAEEVRSWLTIEKEVADAAMPPTSFGRKPARWQHLCFLSAFQAAAGLVRLRHLVSHVAALPWWRHLARERIAEHRCEQRAGCHQRRTAPRAPAGSPAGLA